MSDQHRDENHNAQGWDVQNISADQQNRFLSTSTSGSGARAYISHLQQSLETKLEAEHSLKTSVLKLEWANEEMKIRTEKGLEECKDLQHQIALLRGELARLDETAALAEENVKTVYPPTESRLSTQLDHLRKDILSLKEAKQAQSNACQSKIQEAQEKLIISKNWFDNQCKDYILSKSTQQMAHIESLKAQLATVMPILESIDTQKKTVSTLKKKLDELKHDCEAWTQPMEVLEKRIDAIDDYVLGLVASFGDNANNSLSAEDKSALKQFAAPYEELFGSLLQMDKQLISCDPKRFDNLVVLPTAKQVDDMMTELDLGALEKWVQDTGDLASNPLRLWLTDLTPYLFLDYSNAMKLLEQPELRYNAGRPPVASTSTEVSLPQSPEMTEKVESKGVYTSQKPAMGVSQPDFEMENCGLPPQLQNVALPSKRSNDSFNNTYRFGLMPKATPAAILGSREEPRRPVATMNMFGAEPRHHDKNSTSDREYGNDSTMMDFNDQDEAAPHQSEDQSGPNSPPMGQMSTLNSTTVPTTTTTTTTTTTGNATSISSSITDTTPKTNPSTMQMQFEEFGEPWADSSSFQSNFNNDSFDMPQMNEMDESDKYENPSNEKQGDSTHQFEDMFKEKPKSPMFNWFQPSEK